MVDGTDDDEEDVPLTSLRKKTPKNKPRIRISLGEGGEKEKTVTKRASKRNRSNDADDEAGLGEEADSEPKETPIPRKKRRVASSGQKAEKVTLDEKPRRKGKKRKTKPVDSGEANGGAATESEDEIPVAASKADDSDTEEEHLPTPVKKQTSKQSNDTNDKSKKSGRGVESKTDGGLYLDPSFWKKERDSLEQNFKAARNHFCKRGPWAWPSELSDDKFHDVATLTLNKMGK